MRSSIRILLVFMCGIAAISVIWYYICHYQIDRKLKEDLRAAQIQVFQELKREFDQVLSEKDRRGLKFLSNAEIIKTASRSNKLVLVQENGILKISLPGMILLFSLNEIDFIIRSVLNSSIDFHFDRDSNLYLTQTFTLVPDQFYISYGINTAYISGIKRQLFVDAIIRAGIMIILSAAIGVYLSRLYKHGDKKELLQELACLKKIKEQMSVESNKIRIEQLLAESLIKDSSKNLSELNHFCSLVAEYFKDQNVRMIFEHDIPHDLKITMHNLNFYAVVVSILFHKLLLSSTEIRVTITKIGDVLETTIQDNGFKIEKDKMFSYTKDLRKPSFILEWVQIIALLSDNNIRLTQRIDRSFNFIKLNVPLESHLDNVCFLENFRS